MTRKPVRIGGLASLVAVLALCGCDLLVSADTRVSRATTALEAGQLDAAVADLRKVVDKDKNRADAWLLLSRASLKYGDAESALKDSERAQAAGAPAEAVLAVRDEALLIAGRYDELLKSEGVEAGSTAHRVAVAKAQAALGRKAEAQQTLDAVLAQDADHIEARLLQVRILLADSRESEARAALDALLAKAPETARAHLIKAQLALADRDTTAAIAAFTRAQELAARQLSVPEQLTLMGALAETLLQAGDVASAAKWQSQLQQRAPQVPLTQLLTARVLLAQGDAAAAVGTLQKLLATQPDMTSARVLLGAALMEQGAAGQAEENLLRVIADHPEEFSARSQLAQLYVSQGKVQDASRVMAQLPAGSASDPRADWLRSSILALSGKTGDALAMLERAARADPRNIPLQLDLARQYLQADRREDAKRVLASVPPEKAGKNGKHLELLTQISGQSPTEARQTLARLKAANPRDAQMLVHIAQLQAYFGETQASGETYRGALGMQSSLPEAHLGLAGIAMRRGDVATAEAELKLALAADPRNENAFLGLAAVAMRQGKPADAQRMLEQAISAIPAAVQSRIALATMALGAKDADRAKALLTQAVEVSRDKGATLVAAGDVYQKASQPAEALKLYEDAAKRGQRDALVRVATAQFALNQPSEARRSLESASTSHPDWPAPVAMLASLDASERKYDSALQRIDRLRKAGATEAATEELRGSVLLAQGRYAEADRALARAYQLQPQGPLALKVFNARLLARSTEPYAVLRQWLTRQPDDQSVRFALAQHLHTSGDVRGAKAEYEIIANASPTPEVLNNLAWIYQLAKDPAALATAKRAFDAAPGNPAIADTYGWVLLENGRAKEALPLLEQAAKALPDNAEVQARLARAKSEAGN
jgi:putative PEP-CTERM system TPR-repeat lipoprotein